MLIPAEQKIQHLDFRIRCKMLAIIDSDDANATNALAQVLARFEEQAASLSRFRDNSELTALNDSDGKPIHMRETLWQVIQSALDAAQKSNGLPDKSF